MFTKKISKNASAVVTGAGSGIGRAFALEVARRGGRVVVSDISLERARETVELIVAAGGEAWPVLCDVSLLADVEALADEAERLLTGPVDLVINNAGIGIGGQPIGEVSIEDWQFTVAINLWGVVHGCHVFAPRLRAAGRGGIINVCSAASFTAAPLMGPYNVTKAAVLALSETLAAEMSGTGIKVTALCPTFVKTNIARDGRISGAPSQFTQRVMDAVGVSPDGVARTTLSALDRGQLYVLPQIDARMTWRIKRLAPVAYNRGSGLLGRLMERATG